MPKKPSRLEVTIEDAQIILRNFAGKPTQYNAAGNRNFGVILTDDVAEAMRRDGWNVKLLTAKEEGDSDRPWLKVSVGYKFPPRIICLTEKARTMITEDTVETMDWVNIKTVDLTIVGAPWEVNDATGIKAWLKTMYLTVDEEYLDKKYAVDMGEHNG